jgi:hypothetical protein
MLTKFNEQSAIGSSGKPSFLSTHPNVVGVASHDILYSSASSNDCSTVDLTSSSADTPFSRSPFKSTGQSKSHVECIQVVDSPMLKPLDRGLDVTRNNTAGDESRRNRKILKGKSKTQCNERSGVDILSGAAVLISANEYAQAMDMLLGLVESKSHLIQGDTKLKVHENISFLAVKLGWL